MEENKDPVKKSAREMGGEYCREIAALVLVFIPLEMLINKSGFNFWWGLGTTIASGVFLGLGIYLEWSRKV